MEVNQELIQILIDTKKWASDTKNIDLNDMYNSWVSQEELLAEIDRHIAEAKTGLNYAGLTDDAYKLYRLYLPTAGLCEIVTHDSSFSTYMKLASRFDQWRASISKS